MEVYLEDGMLLQTLQYCVGQRDGPSIPAIGAPDRISTQEDYQEGKLITGFYYNTVGELITSIDDGRGFRALFWQRRCF